MRQKFAQLHPIVNLLYLAGVLCLTMMTLHPLLLVCSFCVSGWYSFRLFGRRAWKQSALLLLPVLIFMAGILPLFSHNGVTPLFYINGMAVTAERIVYGIAMSILLVSIFQWFQVWNALLDNERFLYLFGRWLPSVGLLLSMALRLLPVMRIRFREIQDAQKGLGRRVERMNWIRRGRFFLKECSVLIAWSLEASMDTAISMESRGYGTGRRSSFQLFPFSRADGIWCGVFCILFGVSLVMVAEGAFDASYFPELLWPVGGIRQTAGLVFFLAGAVLPVIWDGKGERT